MSSGVTDCTFMQAGNSSELQGTTTYILGPTMLSLPVSTGHDKSSGAVARKEPSAMEKNLLRNSLRRGAQLIEAVLKEEDYYMKRK